MVRGSGVGVEGRGWGISAGIDFFKSGAAPVMPRSDRAPRQTPSIPTPIRAECSLSRFFVVVVVVLISEDIKQVEGCSASGVTHSDSNDLARRQQLPEASSGSE